MKPPEFIAEISANHLGNQRRAMELIRQASYAGADAVKFQLFDPSKMAPDLMVIEEGPWEGRVARELYRDAMTPRAWFPQLFEYARDLGIAPFASVFDVDGLAFLESMACPRYKIASFELVDHELIKAVAATGKPMIMSTGMATLDDIEASLFQVRRVRPRTRDNPTLLKCTSAYPASIADANLKTMRHLDEVFNCDIGLSDHTLGHTAAVVATALGATTIEKHFTLARSDGGPDAAFSAEPHEFAAMVRACKEAAEALGEVRYGPTESEKPQLQLRGRTMMA